MGSTERALQRSISLQLLFVFIGALILFLCIAAMFSLWFWNNEQTGDALGVTADRFREKQIEMFAIDLAAAIKPLWSLARRTAMDMQSQFAIEGSPVFPLSVHSFNTTDQLTAIMRYLFPKTSRLTHLEDTFIGQAIMLALDNDLKPTHVSANCTRLVVAGNFLDNPQGDGYVVDNQAVDADGTLSRRLLQWDPNTLTIGNSVAMKMPFMCAPLMRFIWDGKLNPGPRFANYTWFGPMYGKMMDPGLGGWGTHQGGSIPIYDSDGNHVGRYSTVMSLAKSVGPLLDRIIAKGGQLTKGAEAAIYEQSREVVLGLSEGARRGDAQANFVDEISQDTEIHKAITQIREKFQSNCPSTTQRLDLDETLIDVSPFTTEQYGMPPLPSPWCLLMTIPRVNVYGPMDTADKSKTIMIVSASVGLILAFLLLGKSMNNARNAQMKMNAERKAAYQRRIQKSDEEMKTLGVPMAVMHWSHFSAMEVLQCFEDQRDAGKLVFLDSVQQVRQFQKDGKLIVLISHQWLGHAQPDTLDCIQLQAMKRMVAQIANDVNEELYVWLDYTSVAQRHAGMQALAINSLPAYVSMADRFVICAPDAKHRDDPTLVCNVETYARRGWCRTEMLAKACSSGLQHMYLCGGDGSQLKPLAKEDFQQLSLNVFQGDFKIRTDMEKLVEPIMGLYGLILKSQDEQEHIRTIKEHIEEDKDNFFPKEYIPNLDAPKQKVMLFGPLPGMMEKYVDKLLSEDITPPAHVTNQPGTSAWAVSLNDPILPSKTTSLPPGRHQEDSV